MRTPQKMKVALYARTATDQENKPFNSIQNQIERLTSYANDNKLTISGVYFDIASGNDLNRSQLGNMMKDIATGETKIEIVICTSADRFSRSLLKVNELLDRLQNAGIEVKFIDDTTFALELRRIVSEILDSSIENAKEK